jgi:hypothetical protein
VAPKCKVTCKFSRSKEESVKNKWTTLSGL